VSPTGTLATEWGPTSNDVRQRVSLSVTSSALRNLSATLSFSAATGTPYTETTGLDLKGDFMFNERPPGVGRNTLRTPGQWALNGYFGYTAALTSASRLRMNLYLLAANLTNHANYTGFSGVQTSPFFRQAITVANPRLVTLNMGLSF
jgi:hypothetical protein